MVILFLNFLLIQPARRRLDTLIDQRLHFFMNNQFKFWNYWCDVCFSIVPNLNRFIVEALLNSELGCESEEIGLSLAKVGDCLRLTLINAFDQLCHHSFQFLVESMKILIQNNFIRILRQNLFWPSTNHILNILLKLNFLWFQFIDHSILINIISWLVKRRHILRISFDWYSPTHSWFIRTIIWISLGIWNLLRLKKFLFVIVGKIDVFGFKRFHLAPHIGDDEFSLTILGVISKLFVLVWLLNWMVL